MNAWTVTDLKVDQTFRITAGGASKMKVAVKGGNGTYKLQSSYDGGVSWVDSGTVVTASPNGEAVFVTDPASPALLSALGRVTLGTATTTTAAIYVMQEN